MGRKRRNKEYDSLEILSISSEGFGVAKPEEKVVFVEATMPGDVVSARTYQKRKSFEKARVLNMVKESANRVEPFCKHFDVCGGCKWQFIPYEQQAGFKEEIVQNAFKRLAKVPVGEQLPILSAKKETHYRNKMEFTFSASRWMTQEEIDSGEIFDKRALGLHVPGNFAKVVDIEECFLQEDLSNQIRNEIKRYSKEKNLDFFNISTKTGFLRNVVVRTTSGKDLMVIVIFFENNTSAINDLLNHVKSKFPEITSLQYIVNSKLNDSYFDLETNTFFGEDYIIEQLGDYKFKIRPKSFFQTNIYQAKALYDVAKSFANLKKTDTLYDLYSGVGSIGIYLSGDCQKVVGIEQIEQAVQDANENAMLNNLTNTFFEVGDVKSLLNEAFVKKYGKADVLITDPPRAGMHEDVVKTLLQVETPKIVYVSCNPSTQARDISLLSEKYDLVKMQAVDMFPQTVHIENVALLELKK